MKTIFTILIITFCAFQINAQNGVAINTSGDNGVSTTFTQHGLISNTPNTLYVWAYGTCGETASVQLTSTTLNNDPASISGVYLWWDADNASSITFSSGSSVSAWADKSGNNYTATQSNPAFQPTLVNNAIGSKPAMRFVASIGSYLINSTFSINLANRTMFVVTKENELVTYSGIISMRGSSPDYLSNNGYIFGNANNGSTYNMINNRSYYNITPATTTGSGTMLPAGIYAEVVGSGTGISYFNGVPFSITGNSSNSTNSLGGILMGRRYDTGSPGIISSSGYFTGDIAEVIMYDRALSNSEKNLVGSYLSNKYSLTWTP